MNIRALVIAGAMLFTGSLTASAQYTIVKSVISSGGGPMSNSQFSMNGTIGQPIIGPVQNGNVFVGQGFWYGYQDVNNGAVESHTSGLAAGFSLDQNYPNPFNPSTTIRFSIPDRMKVTLRVMNLLGEEVMRVLDDVTYDAGQSVVKFDADDLPSGTYVYRLEAGSFVASKKMVLMK